MSVHHANIALFVPHIGCPHRCSFCDQHSITGTACAPSADEIDRAVKKALESGNIRCEDAEIAFFGGSFTAIDRNDMISLLEAAARYVRSGTVKGIRISTRPDAIHREILALLKEYGVTSIELGAQSMDDGVLLRNGRGHTAADTENAAGLIRECGFELGLQMMTGLPGDTDEQAMRTAQKLIALHPRTVRIYPTLVLKNTALAESFQRGEYTPQTLEAATTLCAGLYAAFTEAGIRVIRLGLHSVAPDALVAGPWHPAFSELCQSAILLKAVKGQLLEKGSYTILTAPGAVSKMAGHRRANLNELEREGYSVKIRSCPSLSGLSFQIEKDV